MLSLVSELLALGLLEGKRALESPFQQASQKIQEFRDGEEDVDVTDFIIL